jgi:hypothetical protein
MYVWTLAPGVLMNDGAEFQTLAYTGGNTHPTGYPVYVLSARGVARLPIRTVAYRVNLLSAMTAAAAVASLFVLARLLTGRRWLPAAAAVQLAVSPTFWSQAIIAEVYVPAAAMTFGVLLLLLTWYRTGRRRLLFAAGAMGGLSLGVHPTVALMAPAALVFVAVGVRTHGRGLLAAAGGAVAGISLTLLAFVIADRNRPPSDYFRAVVEPSRSEWGLSADHIDDFGDRLWFSLTGVQYRDNLRGGSLDEVWDQTATFFANLPEELPWPWMAAVGAGTLQLGKAHGGFSMLVLGSLATHAAYLTQKEKGDIHVAYIPLYLHLTLLAACCLGVLRPRDDALGRDPRRPWRRSLDASVAGVLLLSAILPLLRDDAWTKEGRRTVRGPEGEPFEVDISERLQQRLRPIIGDLEPGAILFCGWGELYAFFYLAHVEQRRLDLMFVQAHPAIEQTRLAESAVEFIRENVRSRPVYLLNQALEISEEFDLVPVRRGGREMLRVRHRGT